MKKKEIAAKLVEVADLALDARIVVKVKDSESGSKRELDGDLIAAAIATTSMMCAAMIERGYDEDADEMLSKAVEITAKTLGFIE